jgi:hypothetical protein
MSWTSTASGGRAARAGGRLRIEAAARPAAGCCPWQGPADKLLLLLPPATTRRWCRTEPQLLASASDDGTVKLWRLRRAGECAAAAAAVEGS